MVLQPMRLGQMLTQGLHAPTLGGVVATGHEHHAALARQMGLGFRDFSSDEEPGTRLNDLMRQLIAA